MPTNEQDATFGGARRLGKTKAFSKTNLENVFFCEFCEEERSIYSRVSCIVCDKDVCSECAIITEDDFTYCPDCAE